jgi:hypothetical protein
MKAELFSVKYADKHAAAMVYRKITEVAGELGIAAYGLERFRTKSRRSPGQLKISLVLEGENANNLPSLLKLIHNMLVNHPLYPYLSLDYTAVPLSQKEWNFDSYDEPNYQKIFIRKREIG